jgi:hypothetical protein
MHRNKARLEFNKDNIDDKYNFIISKVTTLVTAEPGAALVASVVQRVAGGDAPEKGES